MGDEQSKPAKNEDQENGKPCNPTTGEHAFAKIFKCDQLNCQTIMCKKCMGTFGPSG